MKRYRDDEVPTPKHPIRDQIIIAAVYIAISTIIGIFFDWPGCLIELIVLIIFILW